MQAGGDRGGIALNNEMFAVVKRGERDQPQHAVGNDDQRIDSMAGQHWFERAHDAVVQLASERKIFVCRSLFERLTKRQHLLA